MPPDPPRVSCFAAKLLSAPIVCFSQSTITVPISWPDHYFSARSGPERYSTAQFKLDRTRVQQGHNTIRFLFRTRASLCAHTRLMMSSLLCIALAYALDVCTMHVCTSEMHTPNLDYACKQIVSQGQWNKIYKHVYVLRCDPS